MQKIYSVMIKGRTIESSDLKELLARAVSQKKNADGKLLHARPYRQSGFQSASEPCGALNSAML